MKTEILGWMFKVDESGVLISTPEHGEYPQLVCALSSSSARLLFQDMLDALNTLEGDATEVMFRSIEDGEFSGFDRDSVAISYEPIDIDHWRTLWR